MVRTDSLYWLARWHLGGTGSLAGAHALLASAMQLRERVNSVEETGRRAVLSLFVVLTAHLMQLQANSLHFQEVDSADIEFEPLV